MKVPYRVETNLNSTEYVEHIRDLAPDLIISYSAPQVIKQELLNIPRCGIINVHGALLPNYRGLLPSFWYLYHEEKIGGATVHFMSSAIDDGDICEQGSVDISDCDSMFQLMKKTKLLGGELMVQAIQHCAMGTMTVKPNKTEEGCYFTWPTVEQAREFRKKGKRLTPQMLRYQAFQRMVPVVGLEPTRRRPRRILNPLRLQIPSHRHIY